METPQGEGREELALLDQSVLFLLLLIVAVLLSFAALAQQRGDLAGRLCRGQEGAADVFPLRWTSGVLVTGATAFFAWLACRTAQTARRGGGAAAQRGAQSNLLASILVFVAALIRLVELERIGRERRGPALEETLAPE